MARVGSLVSPAEIARDSVPPSVSFEQEVAATLTVLTGHRRSNENCSKPGNAPDEWSIPNCPVNEAYWFVLKVQPSIHKRSSYAKRNDSGDLYG